MKLVALTETAQDIAAGVLRNNVLRGLTVALTDRAVWQFLKRTDNPPGMKRDEWLALRGLIYSFDRVARAGNVSDKALRRFVEFVQNRILSKNLVSQQFRERYGDNPPGFLTISPTRSCNLTCTGCYAGTEDDPAVLEFATFNRIIRELRDLWGAAFVVISGGEPFMYQSNGKDLLDVVEEHPQTYFMVYTNGTLITKQVAERMEELGNITPAISVEGRVRTTDARRGEGVFNQVMDAFCNLRNAGVPFGISMTATRHNYNEILSDEVIDYYFGQQGAMYGWVFQYMPIGRGYDLSLMLGPGQRLELQRRIWQVIRKEKVFLMDFWNSGTATHGCLAAGRKAGYFYINWNGDVTPCVFVPYAAANIRELYAQGGSLMDLMEIGFFKEIREWQRGYGYNTKPLETGNLILPCVHRDHFDFLLPLIEKHKPKPLNQEAAQALQDPVYCRGLLHYGRDCAALIDPVWKREYLHGIVRGSE